MSETKQLRASRELTRFFQTVERQCDRSQALAFGVKMLDLMPTHDFKDAGVVKWNLRVHLDEARRRFTSDYKVSPDMSDVMMSNFKADIGQLAMQLEKDRRPREANALRCVWHICDAFAYPKNPTLAMFSVSKAAVKAMYAGADVNQIKTAAGLLFD